MKSYSKKMFSMALAGFLLGCALVACGGNAQAGQLLSFDGGVTNIGPVVFQVEHALLVNKVSGAVEVTAMNGTMYTYSDPSGALFTKILNSPGFYTHFIQVPGTMQYANVTNAVQVICYSNGTQTAISYVSSNARFWPDNCALFNLIKANSQ